MRAKPITVVGGGLAGLTLGLGLRREGIPVTLWEAGRYPRHRVCGEFISGRGQAVLHKLGLWDVLLRAGAISARSTAFFLGEARSSVRSMQPPALCISRFELDALLAAVFRDAGGELCEGMRWQGDFSEGTVRASGRRAQPVEKGWRWFGLKVHARQVALAADLEIHGAANSYVGLSRLPAGEVNVCGLFRSRAAMRQKPAAWDLLRGEPGTSLWARLENADFAEESFCAVAGLSLKPARAAGRDECCIGDAITMIPPVTGNGMSMAFEAADLAVPPLRAYSQGELDWRRAQLAVAQACDEAFRCRLAWARLAQYLMFTPGMRKQLGRSVLASDWIWHLLFRKTR
jgi:menaquinone-9 beta-reductase